MFSEEDLHVIITFILAVIGLLYLDLSIIGKSKHKIEFKEALIWTIVFIASSLAFAGFVYYDLGEQKAVEFLTAYTVEKVLSVDNLFVFILIFSYFKIPDEYQHKILFYGIIGAIVFRAIFIFLGVELIGLTEFNILGFNVNILILIFGLFLLYSGIKSFSGDDDESNDFSDSFGARLVRRFFSVDLQLHDGRFFTINNGRRFATLMLLVVVVVEFSDLLFAVDSIPAILSISKDPFILYTSNIFAILGLRSMYFLLANLLPMFKYLQQGVATILTFIGIKMVISPFCHIDSLLSLIVIFTIVVCSVIASLLFKDK